MSGTSVLLLFFLGTWTLACWRALRRDGPKAPSGDRDLRSRLAGWLLSPLLHGALALLAALAGLGHPEGGPLAERDLSPRIVTLVPGEGARFITEREPDRPRYGRLTSEEEAAEPAAPRAPEASPSEAASTPEQAPAPSVLPAAPASDAGGGLAGSDVLRPARQAGRRPASPPAWLGTLKNPAGARATPRPRLGQKPGLLSVGARSRTLAVPGGAARIRSLVPHGAPSPGHGSAVPGMAGARGAAMPQGTLLLAGRDALRTRPEAERVLLNASSVDGSAFRPVPAAFFGGLSGTGIHAGAGAHIGGINGSDIRLRH